MEAKKASEIREHFKQRNFWASRQKLNFILSHVKTTAAYDVNEFAVLDEYFTPIFYCQVNAHIGACTISDDGKFAAFFTASDDSDDGESLFFCDIESKFIAWKVVCPIALKFVTGIFIDTIELLIHLRCTDITYTYDFDGVLQSNGVLFDVKYVKSESVSPYTLTNEAIEMMPALIDDFSDDLEDAIILRLKTAKRNPEMSTYQLSNAYKCLGESYLKLEQHDKALTAYEIGLSLNPQLAVKKIIKKLREQ